MAPSELLTPFLIFVAEVVVLTIGTLRIIFVARGDKLIAAALGFFEVLIWLFAITQVMHNLTEWECYVAFALGFTLGTYLGILIEKRLALGTAAVRIITPKDARELVNALRAAEATEWPGNVRELAHAVEAAVIRASGEHAAQVERSHLFPDGHRLSAGGAIENVTFLDDPYETVIATVSTPRGYAELEEAEAAAAAEEAAAEGAPEEDAAETGGEPSDSSPEE